MTAERENGVSDQEGCKLIPIITTESGRFTFQQGNLTALLDREILKDTPIAVVSIAGEKRLGKSLFLNLLLHYLKEQGWESDTDDWLSGWNSSMHDGFVARGGDKPVTKGIIAWGEPIIVHSPARNNEIAIILLDTEGTFDTANRDVTVGIFAMSTLSSSLQIFNIDKHIALDDLDYLKYFMKQARIAAKNQSMTDVDSGRSSLTSQSRFQNLAFLIRNWSNSDRSYGIKGGTAYLDQELAKFEDNNDHIHVVDRRHPIYGAFQKVSCFLMPEPDKKVRYRGENGPPLDVEDLGEEFISFTTAFAKEYLHPDKLPTKSMKAKDLLEFLKLCGTRIEEGGLPKLKDIDELMSQQVIQNAKEVATKTFLSEMEKFIEDVERPDWKSFDDAVKKRKQLVTDDFRSEVRLYVSEDTLEEEVTKMHQTLDEKIRNELIKKMQKKIILYAKQEAVDHFVSKIKTFIEEVERPNWKSFDDAVEKQKQVVTDDFRSKVRHDELEDTLEAEVTKILQTLDEKIRNELIKKMQKKIIPYAKEEAVDHFFSKIKTEIQELENRNWENFDETIDTQTTAMKKKFLNAVLRPDNNINIEKDKVDLEKKLREEAGGPLLDLMRHERESYVEAALKYSLDEAKEQLEEYRNTFFPLMSRTKEIRQQRVEDFEKRVKVDYRDSKVVKEAVEKFKIQAKKAETSADTRIGLRYGSAVLATGAAAGAFIKLPFAIPICLAAAALPKAMAFISKTFSKEKTD